MSYDSNQKFLCILDVDSTGIESLAIKNDSFSVNGELRGKLPGVYTESSIFHVQFIIVIISILLEIGQRKITRAATKLLQEVSS